MTLDYKTLLKDAHASEFKSKNNITFNVTQLDAKPSTMAWTSNINDATMIRMDGPGKYAKLKPYTIATVFKHSVDIAGDQVALKYKFSHDEEYLEVTFSDYYRLSCMAAKSFLKLGLEIRNSVCISGFNAPPWLFSFVGTIFAGGVASGVYTTNNAETIMYILNNCSCQIAVVENTELTTRYLEVSKDTPKLKAIVQYHGHIPSDLKTKQSVELYDWKEFMKLGSGVSDKDLFDRMQGLIPNECCSLIYTSGTTGNPKGVMMSHDNLTWTSTVASRHMQFRPGLENIISYLPLSHVAAQMCDIIIPLICQATVWFAQPDALKGTLGRSLKEIRPTVFLGVPRVWEKIEEQMKEIGITLSSVKKSISAWAKDVGLRTNLCLMNKEPTPFGYTLANILIYKKVRVNLGLDRCWAFFSAAAPISKQVLHYFASLDIVVCEIYGMSECSGPHSIGFPTDFLFGSVGKIFPEFNNKIDVKDGNVEEGEICMSGRHVFMGYIGNKDSTADVFDKDNWLHSGDIGTFNENGFLMITGRIKELIITAGGENIAPVPIENKIKDFLPLVSNAMVIGDKRKFLSVLLTIKCDINPDTQYPTNNLTPAAKRWCSALNYNAHTVSEIIRDKNPLIWSIIDDVIKETNKTASSRASHIQKWTFLPADFSVGAGELGPTMKVKRGVVTKMYATIIDELYEL